MFRLIEKGSGYLFSSRELSDLIDTRRSAMRQEIEDMETNRLLNTAPADLSKYLVEKYSLHAPNLIKDSWSASEHEAKVDVRHDHDRWIDDRSRPFLIAGQKIEVEVPFEGEAELFYARASTSCSIPPRAKIRGHSLILAYEIAHDSPDRDVKQEAETLLKGIEEHLDWLRRDINGYNQSLAPQADQAITNRRTRILTNQGRAANLGIPLKSRSESLKTYAAPEARRKVTPSLPAASSTKFEPEPVLDTENYEHILSVVQNMAHVMERSPSAFKSMGEEDLRQHFLVQLNGHFEGAATGETFNVTGKTDILLRSNGKNVFIAECKFWKGAKQYRETIDQLLGYTAWRDTKTAILIFNRGVSMSTVIDSVKAETPNHINYKRTIAWKHESGFRYVFHHIDDTNREFVLTVLVFDVPGPK